MFVLLFWGFFRQRNACLGFYLVWISTVLSSSFHRCHIIMIHVGKPLQALKILGDGNVNLFSTSVLFIAQKC